MVVLGPATDALCLSSPLPNTSSTSTQPDLLPRSWVWAKLAVCLLSLPLMLLSLFATTSLWKSGAGSCLSLSSQLGVAGETRGVLAAGLKQARWIRHYILCQVLITQNNYSGRLCKEDWGRASDPELDKQQIKANKYQTFMTTMASRSWEQSWAGDGEMARVRVICSYKCFSSLTCGIHPSFTHSFRLFHLLHRVEVRSAHRHGHHWPWTWTSLSQCFATYVKASAFTHAELMIFHEENSFTRSQPHTFPPHHQDKKEKKRNSCF